MEAKSWIKLVAASFIGGMVFASALWAGVLILILVVF